MVPKVITVTEVRISLQPRESGPGYRHVHLPGAKMMKFAEGMHSKGSKGYEKSAMKSFGRSSVCLPNPGL